MSRVVSFGEILWDKLPSGRVPGGAPLNFAYRLNSFQNSVSIISMVGDDALGKELIEFLKVSGLDTENIQISNIYKTGEVNISIDKNGIADYDILKPVAWDNILLNSKNIALIKNSSIFVFGSLICRKNWQEFNLVYLNLQVECINGFLLYYYHLALLLLIL